MGSSISVRKSDLRYKIEVFEVSARHPVCDEDRTASLQMRRVGDRKYTFIRQSLAIKSYKQRASLQWWRVRTSNCWSAAGGPGGRTSNFRSADRPAARPHSPLQYVNWTNRSLHNADLQFQELYRI